jgi:hypothetical protein
MRNTAKKAERLMLKGGKVSMEHGTWNVELQLSWLMVEFSRFIFFLLSFNKILMVWEPIKIKSFSFAADLCTAIKL